MPVCLRELALQALLEREPEHKAKTACLLDDAMALDACRTFTDPGTVPGRPDRPQLVAPNKVKSRSVATPQGHAALIHSLCHIEFNAINLALDILWRFPGMPDDFYRQWARVAREEGLHFQLLSTHLATLGYRYGDMPAHDGLWQMAERSKSDLLARLALVPRTLEARGLDASPLVRKKLLAVGDVAGASIIDIILRDEIGHVATGNRWFRYLCGQQSADPVQVFRTLAQQYRAPKLRGPFNLPARRAAGFSDEELDALLQEDVGTQADLAGEPDSRLAAAARSDFA